MYRIRHHAGCYCIEEQIVYDDHGELRNGKPTPKVRWEFLTTAQTKEGAENTLKELAANREDSYYDADGNPLDPRILDPEAVISITQPIDVEDNEPVAEPSIVEPVSAPAGEVAPAEDVVVDTDVSLSDIADGNEPA